MPTEVVQKFSCQKEIRFGLFFDGTGNNRFTDEKKTKVYLNWFSLSEKISKMFEHAILKNLAVRN